MFTTAVRSVQQVEDVDGVRIQAEFSRFMKEFAAEYEVPIYQKAIESLSEAERNTLFVDMHHVHSYSATLYESIELQFYRCVVLCFGLPVALNQCPRSDNNKWSHCYCESQLSSVICRMRLVRLTLRLAAIDACTEDVDRQLMLRKEVYVSFKGLENRVNIRELTAEKIGAMVCITGQVVRTHPVHPELSRATFICEDCGVTVRNVEQQFRYTQVCLLSLRFSSPHIHIDVEQLQW
uniref:MCM_OB domain-containing protein n=1 Tax=Angiostrongylus cantonensis TaxID=6313 RepID=A0A0K0CV24_ANGCA